MKKLTFVLVLMIFLSFIPHIDTSAAKCIQHRVRQGDTLNSISQTYDVSLDLLVKSNRIYKDTNKNQRRNIYVGQVLCIPDGDEWNEKSPTWASWPAADWAVFVKDDSVIILTSWFNYPSRYNVKVNGKIVGQLSVRYHRHSQLFKVGRLKDLSTVCIKSLTTDALVCKKAWRLK